MDSNAPSKILATGIVISVVDFLRDPTLPEFVAHLPLYVAAVIVGALAWRITPEPEICLDGISKPSRHSPSDRFQLMTGAVLLLIAVVGVFGIPGLFAGVILGIVWHAL